MVDKIEYIESHPLPPVRFPLRLKITLPYFLLLLFATITAVYIIDRLIQDTIESRFTTELVESGRLAADWLVRQEGQQLETLRLIANTEGLPAAIVHGDQNLLQRLTFPLAINASEDLVIVLNVEQDVLLMLHRPDLNSLSYTVSQGDPDIAAWQAITPILGQPDNRGDKFAGTDVVLDREFFYIGGPVYDEESQIVGAILIGKSLTNLAAQLHTELNTQAVLYDTSGEITAAAPIIPPPPLSADLASVIRKQEQNSWLRHWPQNSESYTEIISPWFVRGDQAVGLLGISQSRDLVMTTSQAARRQIWGLAALVFSLIFVLGHLLATYITRVLNQIITASKTVAHGDLNVAIHPQGKDEIEVLAQAFNNMVLGLREGDIYRDLLGRAVSPPVREQLRQTFASGEQTLEGHQTVATVLMSDLRDFTLLSEQEDPDVILAWLNEFFGRLVPIIIEHRGVVNKFDGDAILAFFGVIPDMLPATESAYLACQTALAMQEAIRILNEERQHQNLVKLTGGIGINTGVVVAGGLGTAERVHYTVIGDTVNTTARLEGFTRQFDDISIVISQNTWQALGEYRHQFRFVNLGQQHFKGKTETVTVYRLLPKSE